MEVQREQLTDTKSAILLRSLLCCFVNTANVRRGKNLHSLIIHSVNCFMMIVGTGSSLLIPCTLWQSSSLYVHFYQRLLPSHPWHFLAEQLSLCSLLLPVFAALSSSLALSGRATLSMFTSTSVGCFLLKMLNTFIGEFFRHSSLVFIIYYY